MVGVTDYQSDPANNRAFAMWHEAGLQFRSNIVSEPGGCIPLHAHSYAHVALITQGWWQVTEIDRDGGESVYQVAAREFHSDRIDFAPVGYRVLIPAWHQHTFTLIESQSGPGEVLCIWPTETT
jgi:hypothetical protein